MDRDACCLKQHFLPAPIGGGFRMEGWWVWCPSVIRGEDGNWHMFASRWKKTLPFHPGWGVASEVVRAVSPTPEGPYTFAGTVLPARGAGYWDGRSTHNPSIQKCGGEYVLFYTGITYPFPDVPDGGALNQHSPVWLAARASKRIGVATSQSIFGPWQRRDEPVLKPRPGYFDDFLVSNPAPCMAPDGSCLLVYKARAYRDPPYTEGRDMFGGMTLGAAYAEHYTKPFVRLTNAPLFGGAAGTVEDPFIWRTSAGYAMVAKDWAGTATGEVGAGVYASSPDGAHWTVKQGFAAFDRAVLWSDGETRVMGNMDRPYLLFDGDKATHLFVATNDGQEAGFATMTRSWNACIPLK